MTQRNGKRLPSTLGSIVLLLLATGCAGADEAGPTETDSPGDGAKQEDELTRWYWHFGLRPAPRSPAGASGGSTSSGGSPSSAGSPATGGTTSGVEACEVCARANDCCNTVGGGTLCTFSMTTCASLPASSRAPYINACKTLLNTVASVRSALPTSCR